VDTFFEIIKGMKENEVNNPEEIFVINVAQQILDIFSNMYLGNAQQKMDVHERENLQFLEGKESVVNDIERKKIIRKYLDENPDPNRRASMLWLKNAPVSVLMKMLEKNREYKNKNQISTNWVDIQLKKSISESKDIVKIAKEGKTLYMSTFLNEIFNRVSNVLEEAKDVLKKQNPNASDEEINFGANKRLKTVRDQCIRGADKALAEIKSFPDSMDKKQFFIKSIQDHIKNLQNIKIQRWQNSLNVAKSCYMVDMFYKMACDFYAGS
jgi:hypothetical protein